MTSPAVSEPDYDVIVVGSGFGGSVAALRLTEKGYRVAVIEAGRRFADDEFAKTSWDLRRYLWAPALGCFGIQRIHPLKDVIVNAGAGVGGGSLVYANALYQPPKPFYADRQWAHITDWESELAPYYDQASRMLGVVTNPTTTACDKVMLKVATDMGVADSYQPAPVAVHFGEPGKTADDPFFGGVGPRRTGCTECGSCMTGCRVGAKNTLVKNYLYIAERAGAKVMPLTTVDAVRPRSDGSFEVDVHRTGRRSRRFRRSLTASQVVLAAGTWGTQRLLHRMRDDDVLPELSPRLGELTRTNSEAIIAVSRSAADSEFDFTHGVSVTSSIHPDDDTHIQAVRYGKGSNAMGLLQTVATDGSLPMPRWLQLLRTVTREPVRSMTLLLNSYRWSERSMLLLVMQSLDNSITTYTKRGLFGRRRFTSRQGHGAPNPTFIPAGHEANLRAAERIGGIAGGTWGEIFNRPMTAHFFGGAPIGTSPQDGVIDPYHRVFNYPGLSVVDGTALTANLGVNPSLTITAKAERAFSFWPNKGETDPRPAQSQPYRRLTPVAPENPAVPATAPAALRLPIVG
ncbi:GMC family oxidoreductase N-terminal domain-containing protein [Streptomyces turgidiscabies]|uniref:Cholesterol oxidase n=1 Tax=Streptomyces turgidiscabies (strain Car8) TaxID=698760 RepID=L7FFT8_STRT8|nr:MULTISPECIES: GMC family oxidoreductase [Streptomyces]ELP69540.1 FAD dependent oxidoreductase [Streptomyces turgidiscabies Car8]MDX3496126.1 GMC family oxidoreductase [Streptomyces turgidiscabies]GAQ75380.1 cholesterol oxidase [Streptomyces turgidiscabies]